MVPLDFDLTLLRGAVVPARVGIVYKEVIFDLNSKFLTIWRKGL
jgi:hypothetical protein